MKTVKKWMAIIILCLCTSCEEDVKLNNSSKPVQSIADPYKMTVDGHQFIIFSRPYGGAAMSAVHHPDCPKCKMEK